MNASSGEATAHVRTWLLGFEQAEKFGGGVGQSGAAAGDQIDVAGQIELADFYFFHPAVIDFPSDAHARHDGYAHAHLHEALDAFDGGHFDGHVQSGAIAAEKLDDPAPKGRFDAVADKIFVCQIADVDFFAFGERVFWRDYQREFVFQNFHGLQLGFARDEGDGTEIQAVG